MQVPNFTVARKGVGSVRFLERVDVRGVDLDAIVRFNKGSIEVGGTGHVNIQQPARRHTPSEHSSALGGMQ